MLHICPKCLYIGKAKRTTMLGGTYIPLVGFVLGFVFFWLPIQLFLGPAELLDYLILPLFPLVCLALVIYLLIDYYKQNSHLCSKCGNESMIELNTEKADNLIHQYNLNI